MESISHWEFIKAIANSFPKHPNYQETQNYREFFEALRYVIPSYSYRLYYNQYINLRPIDSYLNDKATIVAWVNELHPQQQSHPVWKQSQIWSYLILIGQHFSQKPTFQEILDYKNFFLSLQNVLPNHGLRQQYIEYMKNTPIDRALISNYHLTQWINQIKFD